VTEHDDQQDPARQGFDAAARFSWEARAGRLEQVLETAVGL